jgi:hypothetical protein
MKTKTARLLLVGYIFSLSLVTDIMLWLIKKVRRIEIFPGG